MLSTRIVVEVMIFFVCSCVKITVSREGRLVSLPFIIQMLKTGIFGCRPDRPKWIITKSVLTERRKLIALNREFATFRVKRIFVCLELRTDEFRRDIESRRGNAPKSVII